MWLFGYVYKDNISWLMWNILKHAQNSAREFICLTHVSVFILHFLWSPFFEQIVVHQLILYFAGMLLPRNISDIFCEFRCISFPLKKTCVSLYSGCNIGFKFAFCRPQHLKFMASSCIQNVTFLFLSLSEAFTRMDVEYSIIDLTYDLYSCIFISLVNLEPPVTNGYINLIAATVGAFTFLLCSIKFSFLSRQNQNVLEPLPPLLH